MKTITGEPLHLSITHTESVHQEWCTLDQAKAWLRVTTDDEDSTIEALIPAVRRKVETDTRRAMAPATVVMSVDGAPVGWPAVPYDWTGANVSPMLILPIGPAASVTSIKSYSTANVESTLATSVYRLDGDSLPPRIVLKDGQSWPSNLRPQTSMVITYQTGGRPVPAELLQAARLLLAHWWVNREAVQVGGVIMNTPTSLAYDALIGPLKVAWL